MASKVSVSGWPAKIAQIVGVRTFGGDEP
jgi:hypothetical protein